MYNRLSHAYTHASWVQEEAYEATQKYKEGKYILERAKVTDDKPRSLLQSRYDDSDSDCT